MKNIVRWVKAFFAAPVFEDSPERTRVARLLNAILMSAFVLLFALAAYYLLSFRGEGLLEAELIAGGLLLIVLFSRFLMFRGYVYVAGSFFFFLAWGYALVQSVFDGGLRALDYGIMLISLVLFGVLVGGRAVFGAALLSIIACLGLLYAESLGWLPAYDPIIYSVSDLWVNYSIYFIFVAIVIYLTDRGMQHSLKRAKQGEDALRALNQDLEANQSALQARTKDLEKRSAYLESLAKVGRTVTSILDPDELMREIVESIRNQFDLYFVGLFILDGTGDWALLYTGTGEAGRLLLTREFRLPVGDSSIVGASILKALPYTCSEGRDDSIDCLSIPELSYSRSEAALPLRSRGRVLGTISVHSVQPDAFDDMTLSLLLLVADQVAVALDNARLFVESRKALEAERRAYGEMSRAAWVEMLRAGLSSGYRYLGEEVLPIGDLWHPEMRQALKDSAVVVQGTSAADGYAGAVFAAPIKVRGQPIAVLNLRKRPDDGDWTSEEIALLESLIAQLEVALESARLYEETQRRAARERLTGEVTSRIRESLDLETMLRTAVREIGTALDLSALDMRLDVDVAGSED